MKYTQDEVEILRVTVIATKEAVFAANVMLNSRIKKLEHMMNEQMIDLQYGSGYYNNFLNDFITQVNNL